MASTKFNISKDYLSSKIFIPQPPKQGGAWTTLNITILPDYLYYIKQQLTKQQQILLSQYPLQTYLLERALIGHADDNFDSVTNEIINHIRKNPQFWVKKKGSEQESARMHRAVEEYHGDCKILQKCELRETYSQKQYQVGRYKKIDNDYVYVKNPYVKGGYRFAGNLYPWIAQYCVLQVNLKNINRVKQFIFEILTNLAIKAKPKVKNYYQNYQNDDKKTTEKVGIQIEKFTNYLQEKQVQYSKSLSASKDYYLIVNGLLISQDFIQALLQAESAQKKINEVQKCQQGIEGMSIQKAQENDQFNENKESVEKPEVLEEIEKGQKIYNDSEIEEILIDLSNRFISEPELKKIIAFFINEEFYRACRLRDIREEQEVLSKDKRRGILTSQEDYQNVFIKYQGIVSHPENTNRMKYKLEGSDVPWKDEQYLKFLQCFLQFFNVPTNNKKIATSMGKNIEPNHVKHVKGIYMRNMNTRSQNGQIGGGKKGIFQSKIEFLKKDIQNFNMKWFKKEKNTKNKRIKKRRRREVLDGEEEDSDY